MSSRLLNVDVFEARESNVRSYPATFPTVFVRGKGALLFDEQGREYVDFFAGAGALNYGHNPDFIKGQLLAYLSEDGITHALDMYTPAKRRFLQTFSDVILTPRGLDHKVQFCGPTGADAVEAALKLVRLATGRTMVCSFTGGWHGMTAGALAINGNKAHRATAGAPAAYTSVLPYPVGPYSMSDSLGYISSLLEDPFSGLDRPAALFLETIQAEGGIYVAPPEWLRGVRELCTRHGVLMVVDDVQAGCGRSGNFFSFERAQVVPDVVCLSKSIGGYGLPMALVLMRPSLDVWKPAQHTGTFRGCQLSFVAASAALDLWRTPDFESDIGRRSALVQEFLKTHVTSLHPGILVRGIGLIWGIDLAQAGGPETAKRIGQTCFARGLVVERTGRCDCVFKLLPPLTITDEELLRGLAILAQAMREEFRSSRIGS